MLVLVNTAQMSAGPLGNTLCMTMIILCVLSIIGLQIFAHKMSACSDPGVWTKLQCTGLDDDHAHWEAAANLPKKAVDEYEEAHPHFTRT